MRILGIIFFITALLLSTLEVGAQGLPGKGDSWTVEPDVEEKDRYAVVCIINKTPLNINFSYRWGDNEGYSNTMIYRKYNNWYSWPYSSEDIANGNYVSPTFWIRFDKNPRSSHVEFTEYTLDRYRSASQDCDSGKQYYFEIVGNSKLELYAK